MDNLNSDTVAKGCPHGSHAAYCTDCIEAPQPQAPKPGPRLKRTTNPKGPEETIEPLSGELDLNYPVWEIGPYTEPGTDWLRATGGYPHSLRPGGWVYLRNNGRLWARAITTGVEWREKQPHRTGEGGTSFDPGLAIVLDPNSWETDFEVDLAEFAESQRQGYRYLKTLEGNRVQHVVSGKPVGEPQPMVPRISGYRTALLFVWNPERFDFDDSADISSRLSNGDLAPYQWTAGSRKEFQVGERFYLIKTGSDGGIIGAGRVSGLPTAGSHWERPGDTTDYVPLDFDTFFDTPIRFETLKGRFGEIHWHPQTSGQRIDSAEAVSGLEGLIKEHLDTESKVPADEFPTAEELGAGQMYHEGAVRRVSVNSYERNGKARRACIEHHGHACAVCGFDFGSFYGPEGEGFIHVHHIREISSIGNEYIVDPISDLIPLCPNCHAMAHHNRSGQPARTIESLRELIEISESRAPEDH